MTKKNSCSGCYVVILISLIALIFTTTFWILSGSHYLYMLNYNATTCNIANVTYPTTFPTEATLHLWSTCDCGKHCVTRNPCLTLYINSDTPIKYDYEGRNYSCTITEENCPTFFIKFLKENVLFIFILVSQYLP